MGSSISQGAMTSALAPYTQSFEGSLRISTVAAIRKITGFLNGWPHPFLSRHFKTLHSYLKTFFITVFYTLINLVSSPIS